MSIRGLVLCGLVLTAGAAAAEAAPKAIRNVDRVGLASASRGAYGIRSGKYAGASWGNRWKQTLRSTTAVTSPYVRSSGKYAQATWGNRWKQTLGRPTVVLSPYVRSY
jgi:hypothetical protein